MITHTDHDDHVASSEIQSWIVEANNLSKAVRRLAVYPEESRN